MHRLARIGSSAVLATFLAAPFGAARADEVVARWLQLGPGSSLAALAAGAYGDQPLSQTPTILARAVVTNGACPALKVDYSLPITMKKRFDGSTLTNVPGTPGATNGKTGYPQYFVQNTTPQNLPDGTPMATTSWTECEAVIPAGHTTATIGDATLKLPVVHPRRFLVMADTGCRMNGALGADGSNQQNCHDPAAFPFAYLSRFEAAFKPDLIVQVGDWFYRDTNCSNAFPNCNNASSPSYETWGDTFDSWNADVFFPAAPLLAAAPWIMVRGNHESCGRGARGWFAFLEPRPYNYANVACAKTGTYPLPANGKPTYNADFTPSYVVRADTLDFIVHDSSFANDSAVDKNMAQNYDIDLTDVLSALGPNATAIFATHKPSFGLVYGSDTATQDNSGDFTEQAVFGGGTYKNSAFVNGVPASIGLFLSGHIHQFQFVNLQDWTKYAPQLIVGVGGSLLDDDMNTGKVPSGVADIAPFNQNYPAFTINQVSGTTTGTATRAYSHDEFGFAVLDAVTDAGGSISGFVARVYKISSAQSGTCLITLKPHRNISCNF